MNSKIRSPFNPSSIENEYKRDNLNNYFPAFNKPFQSPCTFN